MTSTYSFDNSWEKARSRLSALQARFDPGTIRHLEALGVSEGWRCLEVGAGAGSIAAWLSKRVGPDGHVLATDLDTRLIDDLQGPNLVVRRHDIVHEALPSAEFDLAHARAVLSHLPERNEVLDKMVAAVRPAGWLLCEDLDRMTIALVTPDDPAARDLYLKVEGAVADAMAARGYWHEYGRRLPERLAAAGLVDVNAEGRTFLQRPGPDALMARLTAEQLSSDMLASGTINESDLRAYFELLEHPGFLAQTGLMVAAWGRRPI